MEYSERMEIRRKRVVLALVLSSYMIVGIDGSLVITAITEIAADLYLDHTALSWVQNAYVLAFGGFMLAGGRLGDMFGRRLMFIISLILFGIGSLGAGISPSASWMIASRFVQGVGSAIMAPAALGLIVDYFEGPERVKAVAWYGSISGLGLCVGLVLGGAITSYGSWRWGFLVNIPIILLMIAGAVRWLRKSSHLKTSFDYAGAILSALAAFSLIYALDGAECPWIWTVAGAVCLAVLLIAERKAKLPTIPMELFRSATRCNGYVSRFLMIGALMGYNFAISELLQQALGFSPLLAGCAFLPMTLTTFFGALSVPSLVGRFGNIKVLVPGLAMLIIGFVWLSMFNSGNSYLAGICLPMLLIGLGQGLAMSPLTNMGIEGIGGENTGAASGFVNVSHQLGGAFGLSLMVAATSGLQDAVLRFRHSMTVALLLIVTALIVTMITAQTLSHHRH